MGIFSALGITASKGEKRAKRALQSETSTERVRASRAGEERGQSREELLAGIRGFDPLEFMRMAAEGVGSELHEDFVGTLSQDRQALNRRGFFGSPLNQARITRGFQDRLGRALAQLSLQAGGLEQGRLGLLAGVHGSDVGREEGSRLNVLDLVSGNVDREVDERNARLRGFSSLASAGARRFIG